MTDPTRWLEDPEGAPGLRALLEQARGDVLEPAAIQRVRAGVGRPAAGTGSTVATRATELAPVIATVALAVTAAVATVVAVAMASAPGLVVPPVTVERPVLAAESSDPAPAIVPEVPPTTRPPDSTVLAVEGAQTEETRPRTRRSAKARPRRPASASEASTDAAREARLLLAARRSLPSDPGSALRRTARHRIEFPDGVLAEERELIAVQALVELGRLDDARARLRAFERSYPDSPHLPAARAVFE